MTHLLDTNTMRYRPYLDGLRGIAVIAVVLYHAKLFRITGGFIGVDVFFVLSGFLITSVIVRDLAAGNFSLLGFWERRVRRIIPALFVVIFSSIIAAYFLMLYPPDYHLFGRTVIAQSVFTSNMLFMLTDNYFDQSSSFSPLLHTWSLSVEEQFYILFPFVVLLCVWLARRRRIILWLQSRKAWPKSAETWEGQRIVLAAVVVFGVASLLLNVWFVNMAPGSVFRMPFFPDTIYWKTTYATAGFYLLLARAWELAVGIVVALCATRIRSAVLAEGLGLAGFLAVVASVFLFNDATAFPGIAALLPTLGAAAIIVANENHSTKIGKFLSFAPLVWAGLISYALYLWHWPIFVFANLGFPATASKIGMMGLILISITLAWLSYRFIEMPFRKKIFIPGRNAVFFFGFGALALLAFLGFGIERSTLAADRIPTAAENILLATATNIPWGSECFQQPGDDAVYGGLCRIGDPKATLRPQFVVWGDSHADALVPLFEVLGLSYGLQGAVFDDASCAPITGVHQEPPSAGCAEENASALQYIRDNDIRNIILVARWSYYVTGGQYAKRTALISDSTSTSVSPAEAEQAFARNFVPMVQQLSREGRQVYIVEQVPEQFAFDIRDAFYAAVHWRQDIQSLAVSTKDDEAYQASARSVIGSLATLPGVHVINPATLFCKKDGVCALESGGTLIYRDVDHVSTAGAMSMEPLFTPVFVNMVSSSTGSTGIRIR